MHRFLHGGSLKVLRPEQMGASPKGAAAVRLASRIEQSLRAKRSAEEAEERRRLARNRWRLALMLQANPGLRQWRGHAIDLRKRTNVWWHTQEKAHSTHKGLLAASKSKAGTFLLKRGVSSRASIKSMRPAAPIRHELPMQQTVMSTSTSAAGSFSIGKTPDI